MDVEAINSELLQQVNQASADVEATMTGVDLTDPTKMLQAQFAIQQYSVFVGYQSAVLRAFKDMMQGIIQKI